MIGLTRKQRDLLGFLTEYVEANGIAPTFEEMRAGLHIGSKSEVHRLLTQLHERGAIRRMHSRARAIELLTTAPRVPPSVIGVTELKVMAVPALLGLRALIDCELKTRREAA